MLLDSLLMKMSGRVSMVDLVEQINLNLNKSSYVKQVGCHLFLFILLVR